MFRTLNNADVMLAAASTEASTAASTAIAEAMAPATSVGETSRASQVASAEVAMSIEIQYRKQEHH